MAKTHPSLDDPNAFVLYRYHPSLVAAIIFIALFAITTIIHIVQAVRSRARFLIPFIIGGIFEIVGYAGRAQSSQDQWNLGAFIQQSILLLVAPALFAATIYMTLGRIILLVGGEKYSVVKKRYLTKIFVAGDIFSFLLQSAGGGIMSGGGKSVKIGQDTILAGLFVQLLLFSLFLAVGILFHRRYSAALALNPSLAGSRLPWRKHLRTLYAASALVLLRSVFRVVEYIMGNGGFLLRNEVFLYVFDAVLMLGVMVLVNLVHPGEIAVMLGDRKSVV